MRVVGCTGVCVSAAHCVCGFLCFLCFVSLFLCSCFSARWVVLQKRIVGVPLRSHRCQYLRPLFISLFLTRFHDTRACRFWSVRFPPQVGLGTSFHCFEWATSHCPSLSIFALPAPRVVLKGSFVSFAFPVRPLFLATCSRLVCTGFVFVCISAWFVLKPLFLCSIHTVWAHGSAHIVWAALCPYSVGLIKCIVSHTRRTTRL